MKVLQINAVYGAGSTGRICRELDNALTQKNHQNKVLYAAEASRPFWTKMNAIWSRLTGYNVNGAHISTSKMIRRIKEYCPDVVHLHNLHANYVNIKKLLTFLGKKDIPTVITLHDCWFFTGKCTHYTSTKCGKWQTGCGRCPRLKKDIPSWFFDRTVKMWKDKKKLFSAIPRLAVIGVSDWITNEAKKSFLQNAKIIKRIYNWIDLQTFYPRTENIREKYQLPKDKFLILCIGAGWSNGMEKWQDLLRLAQNLPSDMHIVLGGSVESTKSLPKNITAIGYVHSTEELAKLYSGVDAYVHLSREDTFGKVIAEAMACGTPAVVYNVTACPELIGEGCGHVVDVGDIDGVCAALQMIKEKGKATYSNNCVAYVREHFEKEKLIEDTVTLYEAVQR